MSATNDTTKARRNDRRARISAIRRRLLAVTVAVFVAVWAALLVQLASGHDPALAKQSAASGQTSNSRGASSSGTSSGSSSATGSNGVSPVTTRQS